MPATRRAAMFLITLATARIKPVAARAPANAAAIITKEEMLPICFRKMIITAATASLAPEEIPRTKGPAIGFSKNVCRRKPERARAPPSSMAISALGSLIFHRMLASFPPPCPCRSSSMTRETGILTLPIMTFSKKARRSRAARITKTAAYLLLRLSILPSSPSSFKFRY